MARGRTILDSLRADDVTIPFWLRVAGAVVSVVVVVLVVVSGFTAGKPDQGTPPQAPPSPAAPGSASGRSAGTAPSALTSTDLPGLPAPLTSEEFRNPGAVAAAFAAAYQTWVAPDGPPGSAARVEPYTTADLFAHFPEPTSWPAPSALASIDKVTVAVSSPQTRMAAVSLTQHLLGQDGRPIAAPQTSTMSVTVEQQPSGEWLVGRFTIG